MYEVDADQKGREGQGKEAKSDHSFFLLVALAANEDAGELDTLKQDQQYDFTSEEKLGITELVCFVEQEK
jgi:hypothetical protein